jgi:hypothetical protein
MDVYGEGVDLATIEIRLGSQTHQVSPTSIYGHCGVRQPDRDAIIISTDGACRNNGGPNARASVAVYVGEGDVGGTFRHNIIHTNQQAELLAGVLALM